MTESRVRCDEQVTKEDMLASNIARRIAWDEFTWRYRTSLELQAERLRLRDGGLRASDVTLRMSDVTTRASDVIPRASGDTTRVNDVTHRASDVIPRATDVTANCTTYPPTSHEAQEVWSNRLGPHPSVVTKDTTVAMEVDNDDDDYINTRGDHCATRDVSVPRQMPPLLYVSNPGHISNQPRFISAWPCIISPIRTPVPPIRQLHQACSIPLPTRVPYIHHAHQPRPTAMPYQNQPSPLSETAPSWMSLGTNTSPPKHPEVFARERHLSGHSELHATGHPSSSIDNDQVTRTNDVKTHDVRTHDVRINDVKTDDASTNDVSTHDVITMGNRTRPSVLVMQHSSPALLTTTRQTSMEEGSSRQDHDCDTTDSESSSSTPSSPLAEFDARPAVERRMSDPTDLERPHKCQICHRGFRKHSALVIHHRVHSGEKPYRCTECPKHFSISGNLRRHLLIHTGERPYVCTECSRAFNNPSHLTRHRRKLHVETAAQK